MSFQRSVWSASHFGKKTEIPKWVLLTSSVLKLGLTPNLVTLSLSLSMFCVGRKYIFFNLILFMEFAGESCNLLRALDLVLELLG